MGKNDKKTPGETKVKSRWGNDNVKMEQKMRLYVQFIQVATYGAEAWTMDDETVSLVDCRRHDQFFDFTVTGLVTNTHEFSAWYLVGFCRARPKPKGLISA